MKSFPLSPFNLLLKQVWASVQVDRLKGISLYTSGQDLRLELLEFVPGRYGRITITRFG